MQLWCFSLPRKGNDRGCKYIHFPPAINLTGQTVVRKKKNNKTSLLFSRRGSSSVTWALVWEQCTDYLYFLGEEVAIHCTWRWQHPAEWQQSWTGWWWSKVGSKTEGTRGIKLSNNCTAGMLRSNNWDPLWFYSQSVGFVQASSAIQLAKSYIQKHEVSGHIVPKHSLWTGLLWSSLLAANICSLFLLKVCPGEGVKHSPTKLMHFSYPVWPRDVFLPITAIPEQPLADPWFSWGMQCRLTGPCQHGLLFFTKISFCLSLQPLSCRNLFCQ